MPEEIQTPAGSDAEKNNNTTSTDKSTDGDQKTKGEQDKSTSPAKKEDDKKGADDEKVEISKKELNHYNQLKRKSLKSKKKSSISKNDSDGMFTHQQPADPEPPTAKQIAQEDREELLKVQKGVVELALDNPEYRKVLKLDKTLDRIIRKNPLSILDEVPVDAEDALSMIEEYLDERVDELGESTDTSKKEVETKKTSKPAPQKTTKAPEKQEKKVSDSLSSLETNLKSRVLNEQGV